MKKSLFSTVLLLTGASFAADDLQANIEQMTGDATKAYMAPLTSAVGADLNAGFFNHSPNPDLWGIDIQAGIVMVGSSFTDTKTFSADGNIALNQTMADELAKQMAASNGVTSQLLIDRIADSLVGKRVGVRFQGPTSVGSDEDKVKIVMTSSPDVPVPGVGSVNATGRSVETEITGTGMSGVLPGIPLLYPQINIGTAAGTQIAFRGYPGSLEVDGLGDVSFWGLGINHNPGYWNDKENYLPFGINSSVTATYTNFSIGDEFSWSGWSLGVMASRRVGFRFLNITPYAGLGMEGSSLELSYTYDAGVEGVPPVKVDIEQDGDAFLYLNGGLGIRLGILNLDVGGRYSANPGGNIGINLAI
ncbi:MAG TPA: hypothetical protein PKO15_01685 [Fibrobacteria bacterium]|nr:hypothetical protein [Fibrobacteria bacterium]HOX49856.1 hypothetical protein [Fibrobacteria bacterium]